MIVIGIDPGKSGALASIDGEDATAIPMPDTCSGIRDAILRLKGDGPAIVFMEKVNSQPGEGVSSAATFGVNRGRLEMAVCCLGLRLEMVTPMRWQKDLTVPTLDPVGKRPEKQPDETPEAFKERKKAWARQRGQNRTAKKNALKVIAAQRFPQLTVTLKTCDALLIADYGRTKL